MSTEYQEKIRTIAAPRKIGRSERQPVTDERDGSIAGHHVVHWDGRQDAVAIPRSVALYSTEE